MYLTLTPLTTFLTLLFPILALTATSPPPSAIHTLTLHHLPSSPTPTSPLPLAILTYHPHHPHLSHLQSLTPPPNTTSPDSITQVAILSPQTGHLTSSATATYSFHPPYKGRFRILVDPITGEAVAASYHAWLPKSASSNNNNNKTPLKAAHENANSNKQPGGKGDFDILTIKQPPPIIFDKPGKTKGKAPGAGAGPGAGEGEGEVEEKTFLQKYWWVLLGVAVLAVSGGGGEK